MGFLCQDKANTSLHSITHSTETIVNSFSLGVQTVLFQNGTFYESFCFWQLQTTMFCCTWHVRCWCYSLCFVATTLTDANCTPDWIRHYNRLGSESRQHSTASTLAGCQMACEFDPRCVAIDWSSRYNLCYIVRQPRYEHHDISNLTNYELVSRCNITSGQWLNLSSLITSLCTCKLLKSIVRCK